MTKLQEYLGGELGLSKAEFAEHRDLFEIASSCESREYIMSLTLSDIFEMAKVIQRDTGLSVDVWVWPKDKQPPHGPRIKFPKKRGDTKTDDWIPMTISDTPEIPSSVSAKDVREIQLQSWEIDLIKKWVIRNKEPLLKLSLPGYYNGEYSLKDFFKDMKRVHCSNRVAMEST